MTHDPRRRILSTWALPDSPPFATVARLALATVCWAESRLQPAAWDEADGRMVEGRKDGITEGSALSASSGGPFAPLRGPRNDRSPRSSVFPSVRPPDER